MTKTQINNLKLLSIIVMVAMSVMLFALYRNMHSKKIIADLPKVLAINGTILNQPQSLTPFNGMESTAGKPFTIHDFKDHWSLLFFGFTNCGYVCPTTMASLNKMMVELSHKYPGSHSPQVIMVSVDPKRDDLNRMREYVHSFNKDFIGVRGDLKNTRNMEQEFNVVAVKIKPKHPDQKNQYTVSHSANVMVINPEGKLVAYLSFPHHASALVHDYLLIQQASTMAHNKPLMSASKNNA